MMKPLLQLIASAFLLTALNVWGAPGHWQRLLTPQMLASLLAGEEAPRVLRVSGDYAAGHIPGAVRAEYATFRGPSSNPGTVPPLQVLTATVRALGLNDVQPVVLVHDGASPSDMGTATYIYWVLKSLGVPQVAILNGGFNAWQEAGLPVSTATVTAAATDWTPQWHGDWHIGTQEIERRLEDSRLRLVDARPTAFYTGTQSFMARPGTIAGAASLSFEHWFEGARLKKVEALSESLATNSLPAGEQTASFCNSGHWGSINWFVLSELLGVPDTRLYAGSMIEWTRADRPMDNQPGRVAYYWNMTVDWFNSLWKG